MKRILLIATGGTIASTEDGNGLSPALTGEELAQSVPEISGRLRARRRAAHEHRQHQYAPQ